MQCLLSGILGPMTHNIFNRMNTVKLILKSNCMDTDLVKYFYIKYGDKELDKLIINIGN